MKNQFQGGGGGVCIEKSIRGGGVELNDQLLDPDAPTLASQDKLKVSPKGLPFVTSRIVAGRLNGLDVHQMAGFDHVVKTGERRGGVESEEGEEQTSSKIVSHQRYDPQHS